MKKAWIMTGVLLILLMLCAAAAAEEPVSPGTPTDLCAHEHTSEVFYFDHPEYIPIDDLTHRICGSAVVNLVCDDCKAVLNSETRADAECIRSHVYKRGFCVLCGKGDPRPPVPEDLTMLTLSVADTELPDEAESLEIQPPDFSAALIVPADAVRDEMEKSGLELTAEIHQEEDRVYAALKLGGKPLQLNGVTLRIYGRRIDRLLYTATETIKSQEESAAWHGNAGELEGYSTVPWLGNGYYKFLED